MRRVAIELIGVLVLACTSGCARLTTASSADAGADAVNEERHDATPQRDGPAAEEVGDAIDAPEWRDATEAGDVGKAPSEDDALS